MIIKKTYRLEPQDVFEIKKALKYKRMSMLTFLDKIGETPEILGGKEISEETYDKINSVIQLGIHTPSIDKTYLVFIKPVVEKVNKNRCRG